MKITIVQGAFFPVPARMGGGVEKVWWALGAEFARRGHDVTHFSRQFPGLPDEEQIGKVQHRRIAGYDSPRSLAVLKFLDLIYSLRVRQFLPAADILVTNTFWLPILVRSPRPGRVYVHVARYPKGQLRLYRNAARLQAVSEPIAETIRREVPDLAANICAIPNPLPAEAFAPRDRSSDGGREKYLLYVGRIHPEKGVHLLIEAFTRLSPELRAAWKVRIVGPAETRFGGGGLGYLRRLQRLAAPLADSVEWAGPEFDTGRLALQYREASLFVYPSLAERGETFGLAPLEAMAQGCPALVSDLACFRTFLREGETNFVFDHRTSDPAGALAARLSKLLPSANNLTIAGEQARSRAENFRLEPIAARYLSDFASLLSKPS